MVNVIPCGFLLRKKGLSVMENKNRLIDANALLRKKYEVYEPEDPEQWGSRSYTHKVVSVEDVKKAPTVDAVEVVHGRWIEIDPRKDVEGWIEYDYQCSICKEILWEESNYCPNCGAKMDLEG